MQNLIIHNYELAEFAALPDAVKTEIQEWLAHIKSILQAKPLKAGFQRVAAITKTSIGTVKRKFYAVQKGGWRALVNRAKAPETERGLPDEFTAEVKRRLPLNQRKCEPAWRQLITDWHAWRAGDASKAIPGYDAPPPAATKGVPEGWSYRNLMRFQPTKFETINIRYGRGKAQSLAPQVLTTREGLWVGSHYMIDDLWHDNFVMWRKEPCRVLEFDVLDVYSAKKIEYGCKPRFRRDDGKMDGLKESMMRFLLAKTFYHTGYSPLGTILLTEHGTAAVNETMRALLEEFSRDDSGTPLISVRDSGFIGKEQAIAGMFRGDGGGNPRFKSCLESLRNLIHNELGALPGQTGMDVAHRPESLAGLLKHADHLGKVAALLPPEKAALLQFPLLEYHSQFLPILQDTYTLINRRGEFPHYFDHELEGWDRCGHTLVEYRLTPDSEQWLAPDEYLKLPKAARDMLTMIVQEDKRYSRPRKLSPSEVFAMGSKPLIKMPAAVMGQMLAGDLAEAHATGAVREEPVDGAYFVFESIDLSPEPLMYSARVTTAHGHAMELRDGEKYLVYLNPLQPSELFVHDAKGGYVGVALRETRAPRVDLEALQRAHAKAKHRETERLKPLRQLHTNITREATRRANANVDALPPTEAEKAAAVEPVPEDENFLQRAKENFGQPLTED